MTAKNLSSQQLFSMLKTFLCGSNNSQSTAANSAEVAALIDELSTRLEADASSLASTEQRVRTLISAIPLGLLITSTQGQVEAANPASVTLFACTDNAKMRLQNLANLFQLEGKAVDLTMESMRPPMDKSQEVTAKRMDNTEFAATILVVPFHTPDVQKLLVVVEDVTAKLEVERLKEEFVSMLSHDLRTPLTSIGHFLEMISSGHYDGDIENMKFQARRIEGDTGRLLNMINSLLDIHKLESGHLEMFFDVVPCAQLVDQALRSIEPLSQSVAIPVTVVAIDRKLHVKADPQYAVQVLVNFLANALKFSPPGKKVKVELEVTDPQIKFKVIDQGRGISEEFRGRMFSRFEQAQISDSRVKGGSGLGLAISKEIIEQHAGEIGVESEEGMGCTFWFTLERVIL